ncbi:MAG: fibronectin type III domain-containing protein [Pseudobutyrivibrio sp.]|nr:fibronectin type III domain-containing protein [Pseudobutyrivibrio sp.]
MKNNLLFLFAILSLIACGGGGDEGGETPSGGNEYLNVSDITIPTGNTTATLYIKASANCEWTITCTESWVSFSEKKGRGDLNVTITVTNNPSSISSREATVIIASKTVTRTITITQAPNSEQLEINPTTMTFTSATESQYVTISSNTHWTVSGGASWVTVDKTEGDNNGTIKITAAANEAKESRNAEFTIRGNSGTTRQLAIQQTGATYTTLSVPQITDVTKISANVSFTFDSSMTITSYGACYATTDNPTIENAINISQSYASNQGSPTIALTNLTSGTTYYVRVYVFNADGIKYSNSVSFTTATSWPGEDDNNRPNI